MTSLVHDAFVELFRSDGVLLQEMLSEQYGLSKWQPQVLSPELTQIPSEFRADNVTVFVDDQGAKHFAIVVEIQHSDDSNKPFRWPAYLCATHARHRCPTLLIVVAKDPHIAEKARDSIEIGHPGFILTPIVVTPDEIPPIKDLDTARRFPRLAVLSALSHPSLETAIAALSVIDQMSVEYIEVYRDLIVSALPKSEQSILEDKMFEHYEWRSEKAKRQIAELKAESRKAGLEEGLEEGKSLGLEEGKNLGLEEGKSLGLLLQQDIAIRIAKLKLGELSEREEARVRQLLDAAQLAQLIIDLSAAVSPEEARSVLS